MKTTPAQFVRQVRTEVSKVTWPSRKELIQLTITVIIMCIFFAMFFLVVDKISAFMIQLILGLAR